MFPIRQTLSGELSCPHYNILMRSEDEKNRILKAASIENKDILKEEYSKIIDNYYENIPFIGLFLNSYIILHTNKLKGDFSGNWYNMFYNIDTWYKIKV